MLNSNAVAKSAYHFSFQTYFNLYVIKNRFLNTFRLGNLEIRRDGTVLKTYLISARRKSLGSPTTV